MTGRCSLLNSCSFFIELNKSVGHENERLIEAYCKGPYQEQCIRKIFHAVHGKHADVCMSPEGKMINIKL